MNYDPRMPIEGAPSQGDPAPRDGPREDRGLENAPSVGDEAPEDALHPPGPDNDERFMMMVAQWMIEVLNMKGGFTILNAELRKNGFTLAAYFMDHDYHVVDGSVHSECPECMAALYPK